MATHISDAYAHFADLAAATKKELRGMQKTPIGTEERSPQAEAALWRKLQLLPQPEHDAVLNAAAQKVGHQNNEPEPCAVCSFIVKNVARTNKKVV